MLDAGEQLAIGRECDSVNRKFPAFLPVLMQRLYRRELRGKGRVEDSPITTAGGESLASGMIGEAGEDCGPCRKRLRRRGAVAVPEFHLGA